MQIRFLVSMAAATWSITPGDVVDWPDDAAAAQIAAGHAEAVTPIAPTAPATTSPPTARKK